MDTQGPGPDLVIAGAARSGTSYLASLLAGHPAIDPGAVKEPNYFSRETHRGDRWYDALYQPRRAGRIRMDASMSYTFPQFPEALSRLSDAAPCATVIYAVREPVSRALSHYQLHRDYFRIDDAPHFGAALQANRVYAGASNYERWLPELTEHFPGGRLIVVPFKLTTTAGIHVAAVICRALGIDPLPDDALRDDIHRNDVVAIRSNAVLRARRLIRRSGAYPWFRQTVGVDRLRRLRFHLTRPVVRESLEEALQSCSPPQLRELDRLYVNTRSVVLQALGDQDQASGLDWSDAWSDTVPADGSPAAAALKRSGGRER